MLADTITRLLLGCAHYGVYEDWEPMSVLIIISIILGIHTAAVDWTCARYCCGDAQPLVH